MTQPVAPSDSNAWLAGTRKGAWAFRRKGKKGTSFTADEPWFFGHQVNYVIQDPRGAGTILAAVKTGHLGPTVQRSTDGGRTWQEAKRPPKFKTPEEYAAREAHGQIAFERWRLALGCGVGTGRRPLCRRGGEGDPDKSRRGGRFCSIAAG